VCHADTAGFSVHVYHGTRIVWRAGFNPFVVGGPGWWHTDWTAPRRPTGTYHDCARAFDAAR